MTTEATPWTPHLVDEEFVRATASHLRAYAQPATFVMGADILAAALCAYGRRMPRAYEDLIEALGAVLPSVVSDPDPDAPACVELARAAGVLAAVRADWPLPRRCLAWWADKAQPMLWFEDERLLVYGVLLNMLATGPEAAASCAEALERQHPDGLGPSLADWASGQTRGAGPDHDDACAGDLFAAMERGSVARDPALAVLGALVVRERASAARMAG